jgi:hypothetical protein
MDPAENPYKAPQAGPEPRPKWLTVPNVVTVAAGAVLTASVYWYARDSTLLRILLVAYVAVAFFLDRRLGWLALGVVTLAFAMRTGVFVYWLVRAYLA